MQDLLNIPSGGLATSLNKLVNFGTSHVRQCGVCRQKGFICEICKDSQVIFPFELEKTYKVDFRLKTRMIAIVIA